MGDKIIKKTLTISIEDGAETFVLRGTILNEKFLQYQVLNKTKGQLSNISIIRADYDVPKVKKDTSQYVKLSYTRNMTRNRLIDYYEAMCLNQHLQFKS